MKKLLANGVMFAGGATIGSLVAWKIVSVKYKKIAEEEIESVKRAYAEKNKDIPESVKEVINTEYINDTIEKAKDISKKYGYAYEENEREEDENVSKPRVITPEEFGEEGYPCITLMYHTDGIVSNERGKIVSNVEELIGKDFAEHFGEYEDDSVFIRNDDMEIDYEILKDYRAFTEIE